MSISFGIDDYYEDSFAPIDRPSDNWAQANEFFACMKDMVRFPSPLEKIFLNLTAPEEIDARLSVCDILLAAKPELSAVTFVVFNGTSSKVRLDISIKNEGHIVPIRSQDYDGYPIQTDALGRYRGTFEKSVSPCGHEMNKIDIFDTISKNRIEILAPGFTTDLTYSFEKVIDDSDFSSDYDSSGPPSLERQNTDISTN